MTHLLLVIISMMVWLLLHVGAKLYMDQATLAVTVLGIIAVFLQRAWTAHKEDSLLGYSARIWDDSHLMSIVVPCVFLAGLVGWL